MSTILKALRRLEEERTRDDAESVRSLQESVVASERTRPRRRPPALVVASLALLLGIGAGLGVLWFGSDDDEGIAASPVVGVPRAENEPVEVAVEVEVQAKAPVPGRARTAPVAAVARKPRARARPAANRRDPNADADPGERYAAMVAAQRNAASRPGELGRPDGTRAQRFPSVAPTALALEGELGNDNDADDGSEQGDDVTGSPARGDDREAPVRAAPRRRVRAPERAPHVASARRDVIEEPPSPVAEPPAPAPESRASVAAEPPRAAAQRLAMAHPSAHEEPSAGDEPPAMDEPSAVNEPSAHEAPSAHESPVRKLSSASAPAAPSVAPLPHLAVVRTVWHPERSRRLAYVRFDSAGEPLRLQEGDAVGELTLREIAPSGVVFVRDGLEIRRRVGESS